jgi:predicted dehydrogenase
MSKHTRRQFLKHLAAVAAAAAAAPCVIPSSVMGGQAETVPPSERIGMGIIGYGGRGSDVIRHFMAEKDVQWRAICDVRRERQQAGKAAVDRNYASADCKTFADFREMIAGPGIDALLIATGVHWHAMASITCARAGKDIYCEKPTTLTVGLGRALVDTCKRLGTVFQAGHQRRSVDSFRFMAEVVRKGMIGQLKEIYCQSWTDGSFPPQAPQPVPPGFDYDMWLGPTPWHPYTKVRVDGRTNFWDTGGGILLDMGVHWTDMGQFVRQTDDTMPVEYEGEAVFDKNACSETPVSGEYRATYADGVVMRQRSIGGFDDRYIRFIGTEGWINLVDGTNAVTAEPASILKMRGISAKGWGDAGDHVRNFLDCIKSRNPMTTCHVESAHRATAIGHIGNLAFRLGRKLKFDPKTEHFIGDPEAEAMIHQPVRPPWHV